MPEELVPRNLRQNRKRFESFQNWSRASHDCLYVGRKKWGWSAPASRITNSERMMMNSKSISEAPPPTEGTTIPPQTEAPITDEKPVNPDPEPQPTPQADRPEGDSRSNAYVHGCAGTGTVVADKERLDIENRYNNLLITYHPKTPRDNQLLKIVATSEVL